MFIHETNTEKPNTGTIKIRKDGMIQAKLIDIFHVWQTLYRALVKHYYMYNSKQLLELGLPLPPSHKRLGEGE